MKVLNQGSATQTLRIIPRSYPTSLTLSLRDDQTNEVVSYSLSSGFSVDNDYLLIDNTYSLVENHYYDLTILDQANNVIYKDKIFCTDQNVDSYSPNVISLNIEEIEALWNEADVDWNQDIVENIYISDETYDNDYIIL